MRKTFCDWCDKQMSVYQGQHVTMKVGKEVRSIALQVVGQGNWPEVCDQCITEVLRGGKVGPKP